MKQKLGYTHYVRNHIWEAFLVVLIGVLLFSHTLYVLETHQYPQGGLDEPVYLDGALSMYDAIRSDGIGAWQRVLTTMVNRQPLYPLFMVPFLFIFGTWHLYKIGLLLNGLYYVITIISVYALGRRFLSKRSSFLASYIFSCYGFPLFYLHFTYSETAVTAFSLASVTFLAWTKGFTKIFSVIGFSAFFGVASLVRWVAPLFIVGPYIVELISGFVERRTDSPKHGIWVARGVFVFILLGVIPPLVFHYLPQWTYFFGYIHSNTSNSKQWAEQYLGISSAQSVFSVRSIMFYLNILSQQGIYFWVLFVAGFLVSVRFIKKYVFFLTGFIVPYAIFTFGSSWKGDRFILPIYPFMALVSAVVFDHVRHVWIRRLLIFLTLVIGCLNFIGASWGLGPLGQQGLKDIVLPEFIHHPRRMYLTTMVWPPRPNEVNIDAVTDLIRSDWKNTQRQPVVALGFFLPQMENGLGEVWGREQRGTASILFLYTIKKSDQEVFLRHATLSDYILLKDGSVDNTNDTTLIEPSDDAYYFVRLLSKKYQTSGAWVLPLEYEMIGKISVPIDQSTMTIYKKTHDISENDWKIFIASLERELNQ